MPPAAPSSPALPSMPPSPSMSASPQAGEHLDALAARLGSLARAFEVRWVAECASTNSALLDAPPVDDGRVHVLVADRQSAGRGRRGRPWLSWDDASLTFSALWRFPPGAPQPAGLSLVAGLALARALERLGVPGVQLKWPNDVLVHGAKLAGILVELLPGRGRALAAVIGIGINLRLPTDIDLPAAIPVTALDRVLEQPPGHTPPTRSAVLAAVLGELHPLLDIFAAAGFPPLRSAWQQRNAFADLPVCIHGENDTLTGLCAGVDVDGALLLRTGHGVQRVLAGDVSLRPLPPGAGA